MSGSVPALRRVPTAPSSPRTHASRLFHGAAIGIALLVLASLLTDSVRAEEGGAPTRPTSAEGRPSVPRRVEPTEVMPQVSLRTLPDVDEARRLQREVREAREDTADALLRERIACYRRTLVYRCLSDVDARERLIRARLDRIDFLANQSIREAQALELNQRAARDLAERAARAESEAAQREDNQRKFEARSQAADRPDPPPASPSTGAPASR